MLAERLESPTTPLGIYLEEASIYRPIATGDIFRGVKVPGADEDESSHDLTMVIAHPSAMRKGAALEDRVRAAPVAPVDGLSQSRWANGYYNVFPLPRLSDVAKSNGFDTPPRSWGALLAVAAAVRTSDLDVTQRVACLSPEGIKLLLQRVVHADTRVAVRPDTIASVFRPKLEEIELLESWTEAVVPPMLASGTDRASALISAASSFEEFLVGTSVDEQGTTRRHLIDDPTSMSRVRRAVMTEILRVTRERPR